MKKLSKILLLVMAGLAIQTSAQYTVATKAVTVNGTTGGATFPIQYLTYTNSTGLVVSNTYERLKQVDSNAATNTAQDVLIENAIADILELASDTSTISNSVVYTSGDQIVEGRKTYNDRAYFLSTAHARAGVQFSDYIEIGEVVSGVYNIFSDLYGDLLNFDDTAGMSSEVAFYVDGFSILNDNAIALRYAPISAVATNTAQGVSISTNTLNIATAIADILELAETNVVQASSIASNASDIDTLEGSVVYVSTDQEIADRKVFTGELAFGPSPVNYMYFYGDEFNASIESTTFDSYLYFGDSGVSSDYGFYVDGSSFLNDDAIALRYAPISIDDEVVHNEGNESIGGVKTFTNSVVVGSGGATTTMSASELSSSVPSVDLATSMFRLYMDSADGEFTNVGEDVGFHVDDNSARMGNYNDSTGWFEIRDSGAFLFYTGSRNFEIFTSSPMIEFRDTAIGNNYARVDFDGQALQFEMEDSATGTIHRELFMELEAGLPQYRELQAENAPSLPTDPKSFLTYEMGDNLYEKDYGGIRRRAFTYDADTTFTSSGALTGWTSELANGATLSTAGVTITKTANYKISWDCAFHGGGGDLIELQPWNEKSGSEADLVVGKGYRTTPTVAAQVGSTSGSGIASLVAGDVVSIRMQSTTLRTLTIDSLSLQVEQM